MGYVAVTVGFAALGAYLGRDLSGGVGLLLFVGAFAAILGLNVAVARGREQLAVGLLFGIGLLLGLAVAPVIADYANATSTTQQSPDILVPQPGDGTIPNGRTSLASTAM